MSEMLWKIKLLDRIRKLSKRKALWGGMLLLLLGLVLVQNHQEVRRLLSSVSIVLASQSRGETAPEADPAGSVLPVETISIQSVNSFQTSRTYTGQVVARRTSELGFERSGALAAITVDEGDRVAAATPLASLDTSNLKAEQQELLAQRAEAVAQLQEMLAGPRAETIEAARATVRDLEAQLALARKKHTRREGLYREGAISLEQLDEVSYEENILQARLDEAQSQLDELLAGTRHEQIAAQKALIEQLDARIANLKVDLAKSVLRAPFPGTIAARLVDEGTVIAVGQSILRLVEDASLEAHIGIPVPAASELEPGQVESLQIGSGMYSAQITAILPELDSNTRTLTAVLSLEPAATQKVAPGQVVRLQLTETVPTAGYWLPTSALVQGVRGLWSCYTLAELPETATVATTPENYYRVERQDVEVLHTEGDRVLVRGTLQDGDQVVISGPHRLAPGQLAQPKDTLRS